MALEAFGPSPVPGTLVIHSLFFQRSKAIDFLPTVAILRHLLLADFQLGL